jgi:hypothetical protein
MTKYHSQKMVVDGINLDSKKEAQRWCELRLLLRRSMEDPPKENALILRTLFIPKKEKLWLKTPKVSEHLTTLLKESLCFGYTA